MPPQEVNVTIDTCGMTTFVYANLGECHEGMEDNDCRKGFDRTKSNTFKHIRSEHFESPLGIADGILGNEVITVIGVAEQVVSYMSAKTQTNGFISMFAPVLPIDSTEASHLQFLAAESMYPIVSLYTPRCGLEMHTVTIGKSDDTNCNSEWTDFELDPESNKNHMWIIKFDSFSWGPIQRENIRAVLSTASDHVSGPRKIVEEIGQKMNAIYETNRYSAQVDCEQRKNGPFLRFEGQGQFFYMRPAQYIKQYSSEICVLNIMPDDHDLWTLPYMFFQAYCARFDFKNRTVGFATPKNYGTCSRSS